MKGYKAFNHDLTCRDYQYVENQKHIFDGTPVLCESGFHFCADILDCFKYYVLKDKPRIFEIEASGIITDQENDCTKRSCSEITLVKELSYDEIKQYVTDSEYAYCWTKGIGDQEHMKQYITESKWAYYWASDIGDQEHMKQYVTEPEHACYWARHIGDQEHMKQYVTEPEWAYYWARHIGDREYMKQYITESKWAYYWARHIGDREYMK